MKKQVLETISKIYRLYEIEYVYLTALFIHKVTEKLVRPRFENLDMLGFLSRCDLVAREAMPVIFRWCDIRQGSDHAISSSIA